MRLTPIAIVVPLFMVWGLQLRNPHEAILAGIFSLGFAVAIFGILRTVEYLQPDTLSSVALWSSLKVTIAVMVASLPLHRILPTSNRRKRSISHGSSMGRDKGMSDGQTGVKRKGSDDRRSRPTKPSVDTFRDDLETQNLDHGIIKREARNIHLLTYLTRCLKIWADYIRYRSIVESRVRLCFGRREKNT